MLLSVVASRLERARFLKNLLNRDGLTRLFTHTALIERAQALQAQKGRDPSRHFAWVMIDLDHFKSVNDRFGHPVGDRVLATLAALLRRRLRQSDTIGRYGGEEFVVLFEGLPEPEVLHLMGRVLEEFREIDLEAPGKPSFRATFSAGVTMLEEGMTLDTIFDLASLTKVVATTPSVMRLVQYGQVRLDEPVSHYIPDFGMNGKEAITVRQLLTLGIWVLGWFVDTVEWRGKAYRIGVGSVLGPATGPVPARVIER